MALDQTTRPPNLQESDAIDQEFVRTMEAIKVQGYDIRTTIRTALTGIFGDIGAAAALSYTGDGEGNLQSFVTRAEELFDTTAPIVLEAILMAAEKSVRDNPS